MNDTQTYHRRRRFIVSSYMLFKKTQRYLPPVVRGILGMLLILLGLIGFLGFWMIPPSAGIAGNGYTTFGKMISVQHQCA